MHVEQVVPRSSGRQGEAAAGVEGAGGADEDGPAGWDANIEADYQGLQDEFCADWRKQVVTTRIYVCVYIYIYICIYIYIYGGFSFVSVISLM